MAKHSLSEYVTFPYELSPTIITGLKVLATL